MQRTQWLLVVISVCYWVPCLELHSAYHSADVNQDWKISLSELDRVLELYNYRSGNMRTGEYHAQAGTTDGYAPGPGSTQGTPHAADTDGNWQLSLKEITRVIELANYPRPLARTGKYNEGATWEDGFVAGDRPVFSGLVWISAGEFTMGSVEEDAPEEGPLTQVKLTRGYYLGETEVTQNRFVEVMGYNPSHYTNNLNQPVEQIRWADATNFCARLTQREWQAGRLPSGLIYRLPTEAEWEYACRAGSTNAFIWGPVLDQDLANLYAWNYYNTEGSYYTSNAGTHPVGQKRPNLWGLYDMIGNVSEWTWDWYLPHHPGGFVVNPTGPAESDQIHVLRGSSYALVDFHDEWCTNCRKLYAHYLKPSYRFGGTDNLFSEVPGQTNQIRFSAKQHGMRYVLAAPLPGQAAPLSTNALAFNLEITAGEPGYTPGELYRLALRFTYSGAPEALGFTVEFPESWSYQGDSYAPEVKPIIGQSSPLEWAWKTPLANADRLQVRMGVPASESGPRLLKLTGWLRSKNSTATISNSITLNPYSPARIVQGLRNLDVARGGTATFQVLAEGTPPLAYTWKCRGEVLSNAVQSTLTLPNVQPEHAGDYTVTVSNGGSASPSSKATLTLPSALSSPWLRRDVGSVDVPGWATQSDGLFEVLGSGAGIRTTLDQFSFVYQSFDGDGEIIARLSGWTNMPAQGAVAGVMIRSKLTSGSAYAMAALRGGQIAISQWRTNDNRTTTTANYDQAVSTPLWLRLVRSGNIVRAYFATDTAGNPPWQLLSSTIIEMPKYGLFAGLAISSAQADRLGAVFFDQVQYLSNVKAPVVVRDLPDYYGPGVPFTVSLQATAPPTASAYGVEETVPSGWTVTQVNEGGAFDSIQRKVRWAFLDNSPRRLSYQVTPPTSATQNGLFSGTANADGVETSLITGETTVVFSLPHPADQTPSDWSLSLQEVILYATSYKTGTIWPVWPRNIPLDYVIRAFYLYLRGEDYLFDPLNATPPVCWITMPVDPAVGRTNLPPRTAAAAKPRSTMGGSAQCALPATVPTGTPFRVVLTVIPPGLTSAYGLEHLIPANWGVSEINEGGEFDPRYRKVKWAFLDGNARTLSYLAAPPLEFQGKAVFSGLVNFNGASNQSIKGSQEVEVTPGIRLVFPAVLRQSQQCEFRINTESGKLYILEYKNSLNDSLWLPLTIQAGDGTTRSLTDPKTDSPQRYYRLGIKQ